MDTQGRITLWGLEVFVAAAEERSITAAARRLGASPSAISQQLTALEAALGATLLNRRERPLSLTPAGEGFRRHANNILNEAAQARAELAQLDQRVLTRLRLGMIEDFDPGVTPLLLQHLAVQMPTAQFLLETGASHRLHDMLDARTLDVVVATDMGAAADWMEIHPLMTEPFVAVAQAGTVSRDDASESLLSLPLIQYSTRHHMGRMVADHVARQNVTLSRRFELDSYHAVLAMVAAGAGWTILTPLGVSYSKRFAAQVDVLPLPFPRLDRSISLSARRDVLGQTPGDIANVLRGLLQERIVVPTVRRLPWLEGQLRVA